MGPSADNSMDEPDTNAPAAIITGASYPGISQGIGVTCESMGAAAWIPLQKASTASALPKVIAWIISCLYCLGALKTQAFRRHSLQR